MEVKSKKQKKKQNNKKTTEDQELKKLVHNPYNNK
jgi:hypothetical protein